MGLAGYLTPNQPKHPEIKLRISQIVQNRTIPTNITKKYTEATFLESKNNGDHSHLYIYSHGSADSSEKAGDAGGSDPDNTIINRYIMKLWRISMGLIIFDADTLTAMKEVMSNCKSSVKFHFIAEDLQKGVSFDRMTSSGKIYNRKRERHKKRIPVVNGENRSASIKLKKLSLGSESAREREKSLIIDLAQKFESMVLAYIYIFK
uniref:Uncharacterized protein n=1 Tax=Daphnia galeata TaxID=27404 RepID=A0A8J2W2A9_9CRUS|nr:unnamed protein product [Daphnia galeata]